MKSTFSRSELSLCLFLLGCLSSMLQAEERTVDSTAARQPPTGAFESAARFACGGPSTKWPALFTLRLASNGTYQAECSMPERVQGIDGGGLFSYPGKETGTWQWNPQDGRLTLVVTKSSHMSRSLPRSLRVDEHGRLEAINLAPKGSQSGPPHWVPLSPPYFERTSE